ncbi:TPM domain-containing protein [Bacteroidota bacterium]
MPINYIKKFLSKDDLGDIQNEISNVENKTSGEIRLCIKLKRGFHERKYSTREVALREFYKLGMDNTRDKTGVLIFVLFKEKKFEIVADEGINEKISEDTWTKLSSELSSAFSNGYFKNGLLNCITNIGDILVKEFPVKEDDINELPDEIVIE